MDYRMGTFMSWITNIKTGVWTINKKEELNNKELIKERFEHLFKNEIVRECNDCRHFMVGIYRFIGTFNLFVNVQKNIFEVSDSYNNLLTIFYGIYDSVDGQKLCLDTKIHGFDVKYFDYREKEDDRYVFVQSVVNGTCKPSVNVRRLISALFERNFQYMISCEPEEYMLMDCTLEEKEQIVGRCKKYYEKPVRTREKAKEE